MNELFNQLGVNVNNLLAQALNFSVLLLVLTIFVYKPLLKMMKDRADRIADGLKGADEAETRLAEIEVLKSEKMKEADKKGQELIKKSELKAGERASEIVGDAEKKGDLILKEAEEVAGRRKLEELDNLTKEAKNLIRLAIEKTVALDPKQIDEKLIEQAVSSLKENA